MNLFETTQTIKGWIRSCEKADQLDICEDIVKEYVVNRFYGKTGLIDWVNASSELSNAITERRIVLAANKREPNINDIT